MWKSDEYIHWMKTRYSVATCKTYPIYLKAWMRWAISRNLDSPMDITQTLVEEYREDIINLRNSVPFDHSFLRTGTTSFEGKPLSAKSVNQHIIVLRNYTKWLKKNGYISYDSAKDLEMVKEPKKLPGLVLADREMRKLMNTCDLHQSLGYRDRAILETLYSSGIRRSELVHLNIEDIDTDGGYCKINQGKGGKDRVVPLGETACYYLSNYIKGVRPGLIKAQKTTALFINNKNTRLGREGLSIIIKRSTKRAGLEKNVTPHVFRRSCATGMIRNKANPYYVKELLGHEHLDSLEPYLKLSIVDLKEVHQKCHPREKKQED